MKVQLKAADLVSNELIKAMTSYAKAKDWEKDIYGVGRYPRPFEVRITKQAVKALGGVAEVRSGSMLPGSINKELLLRTFTEIENICDVKARIDGFIGHPECFLEVKVSKVDTLHGSRGGRCLWDIGQWAHDIGRLAIIGRHFPNSHLVFCLIAVRRKTDTNSTSENWLRAFKAKLDAELANDLKREESELRQNSSHRALQLKILRKLSKLPDSVFLVNFSERWATITFDVRSFVKCLA